jgi:hypothetical protein
MPFTVYPDWAARCFPIFFVCVRHHLFSLDDQQLCVFLCVRPAVAYFFQAGLAALPY